MLRLHKKRRCAFMKNNRASEIVIIGEVRIG